MLLPIFALLTAAPAVETVLAVPFVTKSAPEYASFGHGAALVVQAHVLDNRQLNLISVQEVSQYLRRRDQTFESIGSGEKAAAAAKVLGADYLIGGSYQARWPYIQLTLRISDKTGAVRAEAWELAKVEQTLTALDAVIGRAFAQMNWPKPKPGAIGTVDIYAWREASIAAEILAQQPFDARARSFVAAPSLRKVKLHCEEAVKLDKKWSLAVGCSALADVLAGVSSGVEFTVPSDLSSPLGVFATYLGRTSRGQDKEAAAALEAALTRWQGFLALHALAVEHHQIRGAHSEAKKALDRWLLRAPSSPLARARLGKSLIALKEPDQGLGETQKALELSGDDPRLQVELGSRLIDLARLDEAEVVLKRAIAADHRDGRAHLRLGYVYLLKKMPAEAIKVLERSIAESDLEDEWRARAMAHYDLARAHGQSGAVDAAFNELEAAVKNGLSDRALLEKEADLAALIKDARWAPLLEKMKR